MSVELRYYQNEAVKATFDYFDTHTGNPLIGMPTGCHAKGQQLLMFDGSLKAVENIIVGDRLMGPDSKQRIILNLCRGRQEMRKIQPVKGDHWIVNKDHVLALYKTPEKRNAVYDWQSAQYITETVSDYEMGSNWHRHIHKLYRVGVEFPESGKPLPIDPYIMGAFLGDGGYSNGALTLTSMDTEVSAYWCNYVISQGDAISVSNNGSRANTYRVKCSTPRSRSNKPTLALALDWYGFYWKTGKTKYIPAEFKTASRNDRLQLLAGLIDTDGHLASGGYDFISISEKLAEGVAFVARSLGLAAYISDCEKGCQTGYVGNYYRVSISGDCSIVPVKIERKRASVRKQIKNHLVTGFSVEPLGEDDYYGFQLDGDHLYLLDDFTVTHNTGKSLVIAETIRQVLMQYNPARVMMLTHVAKLIEQNTNALLSLWPHAPFGIHSAELKQRETMQPIIMGGVQSVVKNAAAFGWRDILFVDEGHLIGPSDDSQYAETIGILRGINPRLKVIGYSATLFRMKQGELTDGGLFTDVAFDLTSYEKYNRLIAEGYICPHIGKPTATKFDISEVAVTGGDYNGKQLEQAVDKDELTFKACKEILEYAHNRRSWMLFSAGIDHAEHLAAMLQYMGIPAAAVHSKLSAAENERRLKEFEQGELRAIVGNNKLTTGYDYPPIDFIADLQPTCSPGKHVQKLGRGGRMSPDTGKQNCLVLDFAGNIPRNGPINDPRKPRKPGKGGGDAPVRICDECGAYNHASARFCCNCAAEFSFAPKIFQTAGNHEVLRSDAPVVETFKVDRVFYTYHEKRDKVSGELLSPPSMKVSYACGLRQFSEWIAFESPVPFVRHKAHNWWKQRHASEPPVTTYQALQLQSQLRQPAGIHVHVNMRFPTIIGYEYA